MSLMSMTGRGAGSAAGRWARAEAELSSVNRKQLDVGVGLPRFLASFEARVQAQIQQALSRGRVTGEIRVTWAEAAQRAGVRVDEALGVSMGLGGDYGAPAAESTHADGGFA